jgi:hypothetical protein
MDVANELGAMVAPVGTAWQNAVTTETVLANPDRWNIPW